MEKIDKRSQIWRGMSEDERSQHLIDYEAYRKTTLKQRGGARSSAGRKSKSDEMKLIERLDSIIDQDEAVEELKKQALGYTMIKTNAEGVEYEVHIPSDFKALQLLLNYRWGRPNQSTDITSGGDKIIIPVIDMKSWK